MNCWTPESGTYVLALFSFLSIIPHAVQDPALLGSCTVPFLCPTPAQLWAVSTIYLLWNITCQQIFLLPCGKAESNADSAATVLCILNSSKQGFALAKHLPLSLSSGQHMSRDLWNSITKTVCRVVGLAVKCCDCPLMIIIQRGISSHGSKGIASQSLRWYQPLQSLWRQHSSTTSHHTWRVPAFIWRLQL